MRRIFRRSKKSRQPPSPLQCLNDTKNKIGSIDGGDSTWLSKAEGVAAEDDQRDHPTPGLADDIANYKELIEKKKQLEREVGDQAVKSPMHQCAGRATQQNNGVQLFNYEMGKRRSRRRSRKRRCSRGRVRGGSRCKRKTGPKRRSRSRRGSRRRSRSRQRSRKRRCSRGRVRGGSRCKRKPGPKRRSRSRRRSRRRSRSRRLRR